MSGKYRTDNKTRALIDLSKSVEQAARDLRLPQRPERVRQRLDGIARDVSRLRAITLRPSETPEVEQIKAELATEIDATVKSLQEVLPEVLRGLPYALFVFTEELTNYASNARREDVVSALRDFVAAHDVSEPESGGAP